MIPLPMPAWAAHWFGIETSAGEGVSWSLRLGGNASWWPLVALCMLVALIVYVHSRGASRPRPAARYALLGLRLLIVSMLGVMWAQPSLHATRTGLPTLVFLLDDSKSMTLRDEYDATTRAALARAYPDAFATDADSGTRPATQGGSTEATPSRWRLLRALWTQNDARHLRQWMSRYRVEIRWLSDGSSVTLQTSDQLDSVLAREPEGEQSPLGSAVRAILRDSEVLPPAAIVVVSDGVTTAGPSLSEVAPQCAARDVPLFTVGVGRPDPPLDVALHDLVADGVAFLEDTVTLSFRMTAVQASGRRVRIVLREADAPSPLAETQIVPESDHVTQEVRLTFTPTREGRHDLIIEAIPLDGESQDANNRLRHELDARRDKIRVLLVDSSPRYEFRFLRDLLSREPSIALETILQDADPEHVDQDAAARRFLPATRQELFQYDCIILGDADPSSWSTGQLQDLADYVLDPESRGNLICSAGPRFMPMAYINTPLADVLPVVLTDLAIPNDEATRTEPFFVTPTTLGLMFPGMQLAEVVQDVSLAAEAHAEIWRALPGGYWRLAAPRLRPGARVLATASNVPGMADEEAPPLITFQYVGSGRVLFHAMPTWRWQHRESRPYYARYWVQTIHAMCRASLARQTRAARISTDRPEYREEDVALVRVFLPEALHGHQNTETVEVLIFHETSPAHRLVLQPSPIDARWFESRTTFSKPGPYRLSLGAPSSVPAPEPAQVMVRPRGDEFARREMDVSDLQTAAMRSGGRYLTLAEAEHLSIFLPPGHRVQLESLPPIVLWNAWPLVATLLAAASLEWWLRKRHDLP